MEILIAFGLFALAFLGLSLRTLLTGKDLKETCGGGEGECACGGGSEATCERRSAGS